MQVYQVGDPAPLPGRQARQGMGGVVVRLEGFSPEGELIPTVGPLGVSASLVGGGVELLVEVPHGAPVGVYTVELEVNGAKVAGLGFLEVTPISVALQGNDSGGKGTPQSPLRSLTKATSLAAKNDRISLAAGTYSAAMTGESLPINLPDGVEVEGQGLVTILGDPSQDLLTIPGSATVRSVLLSGGKRGVVVGPSTFTEVLLEDVEVDGFANQGVLVLDAPAFTMRRSALDSLRSCEIRNTGDEALRVEGKGEMKALVALQDCVLRAKGTHTVLADGADLISLVDTTLIGLGPAGLPRHGLHLLGVKSFEMERGLIEQHWIGIFAVLTSATIKGTTFKDNYFLNGGVPDGFALDFCGGTWVLEETKIATSPHGVAVFEVQNNTPCNGTSVTVRKSSVEGCAINAFTSLPPDADMLIQQSSITSSAAYQNVAAVGMTGAGSKLRVEDTSIVGSKGYGVFGGEGTKLELVGTTPGACQIKGSGSSGVLLFYQGYEGLIDGCTVEDSGWSGVAAGIGEDDSGPIYGGSLKIIGSTIRNNNKSQSPFHAGVTVRQVGSTTIEGGTVVGNNNSGLLLLPSSSGVVSVSNASISGTSGNGIVASHAGSLVLQGAQIGKSGQGNQGHGLQIDGTSSLAVKIRGSIFAGNLLAALALGNHQASVDLGDSSEAGNNSLQGNVVGNLGKLPAESPFAEIVDLRTSSGAPVSLRGLDIDGAPFLTSPQTLSGPLTQGAFGHRFGLRITGPGSVQSF